MFVRWSAAIVAMTLSSGPALAEEAKLTDPQIAHIAYTADVIDITAGKQAMTKASCRRYLLHGHRGRSSRPTVTRVD